MARLPFPESGSRRADDTAGHPVPSRTYTVYTDSAGTTPANIAADSNGAPGAAISGSTITTDNYGYLPIWWGPTDATKRLWLSDGVIAPWPVDAVPGDRIDALDVRVTAVETSGGGGAVASVAGRTGAVVLVASDVSGVETPDGSQAKASAAQAAAIAASEPVGAVATHNADTTAVHGIADTSALETQAGATAKADAAQNAAIAASEPVGTAAALLGTHISDTTAVHGITDTALLETQSGAQARVDTLASQTIPLAQKGAALGVATLGSDGKLTGAQIPSVSIVNFIGHVADEAAMLATNGQFADFVIRDDLSTGWVITGADPTQLSNWTELPYPTAPVTSVAGRTGSVVVTKADVGLAAAENTADADKPVGTATQAALDLKAPIANPTFTGTVSGVSKAMVGLGAAENTPDSAKPVSTAQQAALDLKAPIASPTFTGTVSGITKAMVGLGSADDTPDSAKPVSAAQAAAIATRAPADGIYVATDPQWGYVSGTDLTTAITAILTAMPVNGGTLFIPDGNWTATGPFAWRTGVRVLGAGRSATRITVTGGFLSWSANTHDVSVESMRVNCSGGHIFTSPNGTSSLYLAEFKDCLFMQTSAGYSIMHHVGTACDHIKVKLENCDLYRSGTATVPGWNVINTTGASGAANGITLRNLRANSSNATSTPFFYFESNSTTANYLYDLVAEDIVGEQNPGGVLWAFSARSLVARNVVDWDATVQYVGDIIRVGKSSATGSTSSKNIMVWGCGRNGGTTPASGWYDVNLVPGEVKRATVVEMHNSGVSGKINFGAGDFVNVLNLPSSAYTGQPTNVTNYFGGQAYFESGLYVGAAADTSGTGTPEGVVTGNPGDVFRRRDGASGSTFYVKSSGTGNTGWVAAGAGSGGDASTNTSTSVDSEVALFSGTAGKTLKRATGSGVAKLTSGVLSTVTAPSGTIVGTTDTQTLTGKRVSPRVTSTASTGTPAPSADTDDQYQLTALAATATFAAPAGTPTDGQPLLIRIRDNGTARTLAWNAAYRAVGVTLPTTTVAGKTTYVGMRFNGADAVWDVLAVVVQL